MNNKGFAGLLSLVLSVAIISVLMYFVFTRYFLKPSASMDQPTQKAVQEAGIDTTSQFGVLESTKAKIKQIEAQQVERADHLVDDMMGQAQPSQTGNFIEY